MNKNKIIITVLSIFVLIALLILLYQTIFSINSWPEKIATNDKVTANIGHSIIQSENEVVYTKYINDIDTGNLFINIVNILKGKVYVNKIVTTYRFENEVVENVKIDYYYARKSDAKKAYEKNNEYNFFNESSILNENILSKDITEIYSNMSKDKILEAIKSNIEL